jgi:hypothetical protein
MVHYHSCIAKKINSTLVVKIMQHFPLSLMTRPNKLEYFILFNPIQSILIFANKVGAYPQILALAGVDCQGLWRISPVTDEGAKKLVCSWQFFPALSNFCREGRNLHFWIKYIEL